MCISWTIKCLISLMNGANMMFINLRLRTISIAGWYNELVHRKGADCKVVVVVVVVVVKFMTKFVARRNSAKLLLANVVTLSPL